MKYSDKTIESVQHTERFAAECQSRVTGSLTDKNVLELSFEMGPNSAQLSFYYFIQ